MHGSIRQCPSTQRPSENIEQPHARGTLHRCPSVAHEPPAKIVWSSAQPSRFSRARWQFHRAGWGAPPIETWHRQSSTPKAHRSPGEQSSSGSVIAPFVSTCRRAASSNEGHRVSVERPSSRTAVFAQPTNARRMRTRMCHSQGGQGTRPTRQYSARNRRCLMVERSPTVGSGRLNRRLDGSSLALTPHSAGV